MSQFLITLNSFGVQWKHFTLDWSKSEACANRRLAPFQSQQNVSLLIPPHFKQEARDKNFLIALPEMSLLMPVG